MRIDSSVEKGMKLSKQQQNQEMRLALKAACGAMKQHFTGPGSKERTLTFLKKSGTTFVYWFAGIFAFVASAAVSGVLIGPGHEDMLREFHAWMVAMPADQLIAKGEALVVEAGQQMFAGSLIATLGLRLGEVTRPAIDEVKHKYREELALTGELG